MGNGTVLNTDGSRQQIGNSCKSWQSGVQPPTISSWVEDAYDTLGSGSNPVGSSSAYWTVPPAPSTCSSSSGQLLFFFNGLEVDQYDTAGELLQPVLAHGYNGGNYGCYYYMQAWYVYTGSPGYIATTGVTVSSGDTLWGYMAYIGTNPNTSTCCWWEIKLLDTSTNPQLITYEYVQTSAYGGYSAMREIYGGVLEAYSVSSCTDLPGGSSGSTDFTSQYILDTSGTQITPSWTGVVTSGLSPQCGYGGSFGSTYVDLTY